MNRNIHSILRQYWKFDSFRPLQEEIIQSVLEKKDTLVLLPTGGGKSICFQVPALAMEGLCLVISPLIALMKDQVENLRSKNITAFSIYSGMSTREVINTLKVAGHSNCKFLYVSPERLETNLFREYLPSLGIELIAVDEAHCISQWGYDFRPSYLRIAALRDELPDIPLLALTASATPEVQKDICDKLHFKNSSVFRKSFERANLSYSVLIAESKINKIIHILEKVPGSSIVYCKSRKRTQQISDALNMHNIRSDFYHAGLLSQERNYKQEEWIKNNINTIVCTNAFGMGIDKPDVRTVIHADIPDCIENYYQEAGRAGRDGKRSYAILLHDIKDLLELQLLPVVRFPSEENIRLVYQALANYLQIPAGTGEGNYYDFDLNDFIKKFKLDSQLVIHSLKTLEQEQLIVVSEQVFIPSKIQFITNKDELYQFEKDHAHLEGLVKALLRTYEGIFDQPVTVSERTVAHLLKEDEQELIVKLQQLHRSGIIRYTPQKDSPQVYFIQNRVRVEDLRINPTVYAKRKDQCEVRITHLVNYTKDKTGCRSRVIGAYFGDQELKDCGICDNCIAQKKKKITDEEFTSIHKQIVWVLKPGPLQTRELLTALKNIQKEKLWKVIEFLQGENRIIVDKNGKITLAR